MSLTPTVKQFRLGIIPAKNLDDPDFLPDLVGDKAGQISHVYTNGANQLVSDFATSHGIPHTVFPLICSCLPKSVGLILDNSDFVYVIGTADSKSAGFAWRECEKRKVPYKLLEYEPINHWRDRVCKVDEILQAQDQAEVAANPVLKAIAGVIS